MDPVNRCVTDKLDPTVAQECALWECHKLHCDQCNAALEERISAYRLAGKTIGFAAQCKEPDRDPGRSPRVPGAQCPICAGDFKHHGEGFRFTPGPNWRHGKLRLSGIGRMDARGHARTPGKVVSCDIMRKADGRFLSLVIECEPHRECGSDG